MFNSVLCYVLLSTVAGSVISHNLPLPHEKPPEWEPPVVISEEFFPPHPPPHHPPHLPHNEFKEIIGIELQRIPLHGGAEHEILEHEKHKEHEILEHRTHEILEHHEPQFLKPHVPPEVLEHEHRQHEIHPHELPPVILEHEHEEHHPHGFHDVLEHEHREIEHEIREHERREHEHREHERREHEHREHEIMHHEHPRHEHEVLEHEHREHDILSELPHEPHHPSWEDPDFVLSEEEHHHEREHEFHHEELFPEVSRRRTNRRREGGSSNESGSRRNNSNSNRRGNSNSNRRGNSNRQGNNNRSGNSNRRRENGINTEELFPRRNNNRRNNNNSNNNRNNNSNNNNRRNNNNNNRGNSRRNSNIEELAALEEEIMHSPEVFSSEELSRPERDVGNYYNNDRSETSQSRRRESTFQNQGSGSSDSDTKRFTNQQEPEYSSQRHFESESPRRSSHSGRDENAFGGSRQQRPSFSDNQGYSSGIDSSSNLNEYSNSNTRRPERPSGNIFVKEEEYLTLDGSGSQRPSSRPSGSSFGNNEQSWNQGSQMSSFGSNRPDEFSNGESSKPSFLGSRPGSGKPLVPGSLGGSRPTGSSFGSSEQGFNQQSGISGSSRPGQSSSFGSNRPDEFSNGESSSFLGSRPGSGKPLAPGSLGGSRPTGSSFSSSEQGFNHQSGISGSSRPGQSSSFGSNRPDEFSNGESSSFLGSRPGSGKPLQPGSLGGSRPTGSGSSSSGFFEEERPNRPNSGSSGHSNHENRPSRPGSGFSSSAYEERPNRPGSGSSGSHSNYEERPSRPGSSSANSRPNRPNNSHFSSQEQGSHEQSSRPHRPGSRPEENSRPSNGNNLYNETDLIYTQEDSWRWPNQDEDKQNRRVSYSGGNKKPSTTTKRPTASGNSNSIKKQHTNLKLLPTDTCGMDLGNRIIGGENTQLDEFPWMALLQHSSSDGRALGFGCGGSLISPRYVLTAAHCIKGPAIGKNIRVSKVRLGEFDTSSDVDCQGEICSPPPVDVAVEEIIVHPRYRSTDRAQLNDIALIRLKENVKNSAYISPICLPIYGTKDYAGEKLTTAGWGKTSNGQNGKSSKTKLKVSLPVVTLEECSPFYNRINIQLNNTQMCAGGERGKDSCQGDSGGPLMGSEVIDSQVRWQVHGIVSFGPEDCGIDNVAGVYTKVSEYLDWILDNMKR